MHEWVGLKTVIKVERKREKKNSKCIEEIIREETSYYLSSKEISAKDAGKYIRQHWHIENSLHHVLDVSFREDHSKIRTKNAPENLNILRKLTTNIIRLIKPQKRSFKTQRLGFNWNDDFLFNLLNHFS